MRSLIFGVLFCSVMMISTTADAGWRWKRRCNKRCKPCYTYKAKTWHKRAICKPCKPTYCHKCKHDDCGNKCEDRKDG